ncbi:hypothetical protein FA15DRAFT_709965 [Coprinopsis marcescibilis]|uniref:Uncharacterized protein n=1 Tax=Coprinopsis marcescibilis TaxID=230819 RepID=A0A5C3KEI5_COPMA|nr:hypothetical protein FA15DRAFT_709965 [Coprinopsis marcescibilis]
MLSIVGSPTGANGAVQGVHTPAPIPLVWSQLPVHTPPSGLLAGSRQHKSMLLPTEKPSGTASAAWLGGGFAAILKWKTANNINWMIHVMLHYHTQIVQSKQEINMEEDDEDEQEEEE